MKPIFRALLTSAMVVGGLWSAPATASDLDVAYDARITADDYLHGRFAVGHLLVDDTTDLGRRDYNITHLYYRLVSERVGGNENVKINLDGRYRYAHDLDWNHKIPDNRLLQANVEFENLFDYVDLKLGRSFIEEFVSQGVDGVDAKVWLSKYNGVGLFGGMRPDPFNDDFNPDFTTYGAYAFSKTDVVGASAGYAIDNYKGRLDRERANVNLFFMPASQWWHVQASVDLDNDFDSTKENPHGGYGGWYASNAMVHANIRPNDWFQASLTYNEFMAIVREVSIEEMVGEGTFTEDKYSITRLKVELRPLKNIGVYAGNDARWREYDGATASQYYVGVRDYDFIGHTRWDLRYANLEWFTADVRVYTGSFGISRDRVDADVTVTYLNNRQRTFNLGGDLNQWIYEATGSFWFTKHVYATLNVSYAKEEFLDVPSIYESRYDTAFTSTTVYGQVGYRF
jgi:hypothetical protein